MKGFKSANAIIIAAALVLAHPAIAQQAAEEIREEPSVSMESVNINTDDAETLADVLDGVGLTRAQAIVEYREENGPFASAEELTEVKGIGESTLARNSEKIDLK